MLLRGLSRILRETTKVHVCWSNIPPQNPEILCFTCCVVAFSFSFFPFFFLAEITSLMQCRKWTHSWMLWIYFDLACLLLKECSEPLKKLNVRWGWGNWGPLCSYAVPWSRRPGLWNMIHLWYRFFLLFFYLKLLNNNHLSDYSPWYLVFYGTA